MNRDQAREVMAAIDARFPHSKLTDENRSDLMSRLMTIDGVSVEQAVAAVAEYSVESRRSTPVSGDILQAVRRTRGEFAGGHEGISEKQGSLRDFARKHTEAFHHLCEQAHGACECPAHYRHAPDCYIVWPVSAAWMYDRLNGLVPGATEPLRALREHLANYRDPYRRRELDEQEVEGLKYVERALS